MRFGDNASRPVVPTAVVGTLLVLQMLQGGAPGVLQAMCPPVPADMVQRLFEALKRTSVEQSYTFDGISADGDDVRVRWSRDGVACPTIRVGVQNCDVPSPPATLRLDVPSDLLERCPGLQDVARTMSRIVSLEHLDTRMRGAPSDAAEGRLRLWFALLIAVASTCGLLLRWHVPPASRKGVMGSVAWVALAAAAATPFVLDIHTAVSIVLSAVWIAFLVLVLDRIVSVIPSREWARALIALFLVSFVMRWCLASGGPGDVSLSLTSLWKSQVDLRWGPAPISLLRLVGLVRGHVWDTEILWINLIASSLIPVLLYGIVASLGVTRLAAFAAALVVAAHPMLISFSRVLDRQPIYQLAAFGSLLALTGFLNRARGRDLVTFLCGTILAITSRPEGAHLLLVALAMLLLMPAAARVRIVAGLVFAMLLVTAWVYVRFLLDASPRVDPLLVAVPFLWTIVASADFTPAAWIVVWVGGLLVGIRRRAAWVAILSLGALDLAWRWTGLYQMFAGHERQVASSRYETILFVPFSIGVALLMQTIIVRARMWSIVTFGVVFLAATALTYARPYDTLLKSFTVDYEYAFLRRYALSLPSESILYIFDSPIYETGFRQGEEVGHFAGSPLRMKLWSTRDCQVFPSELEHAYLYIGSACAPLVDNDPGRPLPMSDYTRLMRDCAAMLDQVGNGSVEEIDVPARKMTWQDFRDSRVHLGIYKLDDASVCQIGTSRSY